MEHIDSISSGMFSSNYDITTADFRTAKPQVSFSYGTKTNCYEQKTTHGDYKKSNQVNTKLPRI